ncbi:MAG: hypothetical protein HC925_04850, partial [Coleofasciculaceae cyanobacterium SM2_3_26]|nr:hypothetical protein [Coleofasciculaceae cyanobacterium SM2_3_26]
MDNYLTTTNPDIVLLMLGTNDMDSSQSVSEIINSLGNIIDSIVEKLPDTKVLVSTVPPAGDGQRGTRVQKTEEYNQAIPGMVASKNSDNIRFVDMFSSNVPGHLTKQDITTPQNGDNGLHPTLEGYEKIASFWYEALNTLGTDQGTFSVDRDILVEIENLVGSAFNDTLVGDAGDNRINGNSGDDLIEGGNGADTLIGGGGADTFTYNSASAGQDLLTDFDRTQGDQFQISAAGFGGGLQAGVDLSGSVSSTGVFVSGNAPTALGSSANFLYDTATGLLSVDLDGARFPGA